MVKIITAGRTDTKDLFEIGDPFQWERLNHTPFLVFVEEGETIRVEIVNSKKKLLAYSNETKVMVQWRGVWEKSQEEVLVQLAYQQANIQLGKALGQPDGYLRAADEIQMFKSRCSIQ